MSEQRTMSDPPQEAKGSLPAQQNPSSLGKRLVREPLLHFLLLAIALFVAYQLTSRPDETESTDRIVVSQQRIDSLIETFTRRWQRPPTGQELKGLIDDYVMEEVYYREGLKMGLDRDDTMIRRRMRLKLEFLAEDFANVTEPSDEELQQIINDNPDDYRVDRQFSLTQVFLRADRDGQPPEVAAEELITQLREPGSTLNIEDLGDPTLLPRTLDRQTTRQITNQFGPEFTAGLADLELGKWGGPIESTYGLHVVLLREASPGRQLELSEVRDQVRREWFAERRAKSKQEFFESLLANYEVTIETGEDDSQQEEVGP